MTDSELLTALTKRVEALEKDSHVPFDFSALIARLEAVEARTPPVETVQALRTAVGHIEHMAAWIGAQNRADKRIGYSFESLGEDMPAIYAALGNVTKF